ncbi:hypothetical protein PCANC_13084 [Puccinia coronata f. sp. avenae]|uniref:Uncharacterized protein n=1 Tax=Puccinia coronata f. sp. avenae TaxID=200324 RepID=A0A2N5UV28_9BASI|nr:hypothetical protein PCANC_13084 [Puccinia coronata f. sp. avenae]
MAHEETSFSLLCMKLLEPIKEGGKSHDEKMDELRRLFPKTKRWLDWWSMADVSCTLFPSLRTIPEDGKTLPNTTNAQESMHRLYYMISDGKKSLMLGMVDLYTFVKMLEEDWNAVMRGISIEYGSKSISQEDVGVSMGWSKKRKRQDRDDSQLASTRSQRHEGENDGQAPDTTATLLPETVRPKKKAGRPKSSPNIDRNPMTTFPSYCALKNSKTPNRCWLAVALETLYCLFSPLWVVGTDGSGKDLFTNLTQHFNSRATYDFTQKGQIQSILTKAQNKLFEIVHKKYPGRFEYGAFALLDYFIELCLDPKRNPPRQLKKLFVVEEHRVYSCPLGHPQPDSRDRTREVFSISIYEAMFAANNLETHNVAGLINLLTNGTGLLKNSGIQCIECNKLNPNRKNDTAEEPASSSQESIIEIVKEPADTTNMVPLTCVSTINFACHGPPLHLYYVINHQTRD